MALLAQWWGWYVPLAAPVGQDPGQEAPVGVDQFTASDDVCLIAFTSGTTGPLVNTATITPPPGTTDPAPGSNTATDANPANQQADLTVSKSSTPNSLATTTSPLEVITYFAGRSPLRSSVAPMSSPSVNWL